MRDGGQHSFDEVDIGKRTRCWSTGLSGLAGILAPDQSMANHFSAELERGRTARPPYKPYVTTDSIAKEPWLPSGEPHIRSLGRWKASQLSFHRFAGKQDLAIGQYALYRLRFILAGDLAGAWEEFGGLPAQINHLANVIELPIADHAGIAVTYDRRIRALIAKTALKRPTTTDYNGLLSTIHAEAKAAVLRDFETPTEAIKKEKGQAAMEKEG